ncbi:MAG: NAD(P)/FAD-dependent oxidoreductase [Anaerolineaceae bacterium]|nr:NAD(P)/FAD-dependent oxidoreductase [Anaerolineaceae bacterium]
MNQQHIVIVGGGFGGVNAAQALKNAPVQVTLIDRRNHHLFQPLLYQVATGHLSPADIASPLRRLFKRQQNVRVLLGEVTGFDVAKQKVLLQDGAVPYDTLIVAAGASYHYFGNDYWQQWAPPLKSVEDALEIRRRVLSAFEMAERAPDPETRRAWLTFVIIGGGPTGVEMAGALAEVAHKALRHEFRTINPADARIILVQSPDHILPTYDPVLSQKGAAALEQMGVTVWTQARVTAVSPTNVTLKSGDATEVVPTHTVLWAAGVKASPLGQALARATGVALDRGGRVQVQQDLSVPGYDNIFVIGDLAHTLNDDGQPLPGVAQVAIQQGKYVGQLLRHRVRGRAVRPFRYQNRGDMAQIGRQTAVVQIGSLRLIGVLAWHLWWIVHLMYLAGFQNRLIVFLQWTWSYFTHSRPALLITQRDEHQQEVPSLPLEPMVQS